MQSGIFQTSLLFSNADAVQFSANCIINAMWRDAIQEFDKIAPFHKRLTGCIVQCNFRKLTRTIKNTQDLWKQWNQWPGCLMLSWESCSIEYRFRRNLHVWWDINTVSRLFTVHDNVQGSLWWVIDAQTLSVTLLLQHTTVEYKTRKQVAFIGNIIRSTSLTSTPKHLTLLNS